MTPAIDLLKKNKIPFTLHTYDHDPNNTHFGDEAAEKLGLDPHQSFKTLLVAENGDQKKLACFVLSTANMLSLKKAAKAVGEKSLEMIHVKDINQITGYIRGGCTAVGMKKQYKTVIDASAQTLQTMIVSGGRIGSQIELTPEDLAKAANAVFAEIIA